MIKALWQWVNNNIIDSEKASTSSATYRFLDSSLCLSDSGLCKDEGFFPNHAAMGFKMGKLEFKHSPEVSFLQRD